VTGLAIRSLRHRATAFTATFLAVFLGSAMIGSFAAVAETGTGPVSDADAETLATMGGVVGAWGSLIVLFSVASTVGITVTHRATELGLLRTVGASPRQVRRLVRSETLVVATVAAALGGVVAYAGGAGMLALLRGPMVSESVTYDAGPISVGGAALGMVLTSLLASSVAARRATRGPARLVLAEAAAEAGRIRWWRIAAAVLLIGYGVVMAMVTVLVTADSDDPYAAMQTSGSSSILVGVGMAALAPVWLRWAARLLPASRRGAATYLAVGNAQYRAPLLAGVLAPIIVLVSAAVGVVMLVGIDGRTLEGTVEGAELVTLLNYVVTGMLALFAAIMVVNGIAAMLAHRRTELARLQLIGATPTQVRASVRAEMTIVAVVGVLLGGLASLATVLPFADARGEGLVPDGQLWFPPLVAAVAVGLTLAAARFGLRRLPSAISQ
jgi:putative ABC transport system permease protein